MAEWLPLDGASPFHKFRVFLFVFCSFGLFFFYFNANRLQTLSYSFERCNHFLAIENKPRTQKWSEPFKILSTKSKTMCE